MFAVLSGDLGLGCRGLGHLSSTPLGIPFFPNFLGLDNIRDYFKEEGGGGRGGQKKKFMPNLNI